MEVWGHYVEELLKKLLVCLKNLKGGVSSLLKGVNYVKV